MFGNDDLFDDTSPKHTKPTLVSKPPPVDPLDDLFDSFPRPSAKPKVKDPLAGDDLFGDDEPPVPVKQVRTVVEDTDDLFGEPSPRPVKQTKKPVTIDEDDLFGESDKKPIKQVKPVVSEEDDLFGGKPKMSAKQVRPVEDDLFDDPKPVKRVEPTKKQDGIDDLFGSPPPLPPADEDEGDLFTSLGPTPRKPEEKKATPKNTPKNKRKKDKEEPPPPSIFDADPVSTEAKAGEGGAPVDDIFASSPPGMKTDKTVRNYV